jgi:hypothetical protein
LDSNEPECSADGKWRSTRSHDEFSQSTGPTSDVGTTCEPFRPSMALGASTSLPAASHARTSAAQTSMGRPELTEQGPGCGEILPDAFACYAPDTSSWKTAHALPIAGLDEFSETWPKSGMTRSGRAYPRAQWVRHTHDPGCSSLPTPTASLFGCRDVERMLSRREKCKRQHGNGNGFGLTLSQQLAAWGLELEPELAEAIQGFPIGWTDCEGLGTP